MLSGGEGRQRQEYVGQEGTRKHVEDYALDDEYAHLAVQESEHDKRLGPLNVSTEL